MNNRFDPVRRRLLLVAGAAGAAGMASWPFGAQAQGISKRPVKFLLAQTPGTTPDVISRLLAPRLQERWDQSFLVENRAGASGAVGMEALAKSAPDGHTITVYPSTILTLPYFYRNLPYDILAGFQQVIYVGYNNFALTVHTSLPVANLKEFIAYVKARPGQLNYGSPGNGTHHHLMMEMLKLTAGLDVVHVPYKGSAGATNDLLGGQIPMMFVPIHTALSFQTAGKVKVLGGTMRERHPLFPNLPSLHEQGVKDFDVEPWYGLCGPARIPADIVSKYNATLREILVLPEMREILAKQGLVTRPGSPEELTAIAKAEYETWGKVVRAAKITPD